MTYVAKIAQAAVLLREPHTAMELAIALDVNDTKVRQWLYKFEDAKLVRSDLFPSNKNYGRRLVKKWMMIK